MNIIWSDEMGDDDLFQTTATLLESSSDEDSPRQHGGSVPGKAANIDRGRTTAAAKLYADYFAPNPVYGPVHFARRFRVSRPVFKLIVQALEVHDPYFTQRQDCTGKLGLTALQKATAAIRILAYGSAADSVDEYLRLAESTALICLERFCSGVIACFGEKYLRSPTMEDLRKILLRSERRGFPGMLGSIDCCKWYWKNCPTAHHGQYQGKEGKPAVTLEAIADDTLWIWHSFFGMPGCANDINVLDASTLCNKIADGSYPPPLEYKIAGETRNVPYWLADGIYPKWPCFVQTVTHPVSKKDKLMAKCQEGARKDAERAFGVLQAKWHVLSRPSRKWHTNTMSDIMRCCIVLHNMMVEYRTENEGVEDAEVYLAASLGGKSRPMWVSNEQPEGAIPPLGSIAAQCGFARFTGNQAEYFKTRELVMNHLWMKHGGEQ